MDSNGTYSSAGFLPPQGNFPASPPAQPAGKNDILKLSRDFLSSEQVSRNYQWQLECRLNEESTRLRQELHRCTQLEERLSTLQWAKNQLEISIRRYADDSELLRRELALERKKSQDLEHRLTALFSANDALIRPMTDASSPTKGSSYMQPDTDKIVLENMRLQELVGQLKAANHFHEETIKALRTALQAFHDTHSSSSSSDGSSTAVRPTGNLIEASTAIQTDYAVETLLRNPENLQNAQETTTHAGTWYEDDAP
ncbi:hypothetical protein KXX13_003633 [Aspergillus fumigatus]|nr:hypothetical protein KXX13_003633 [Aspergillus fumigatus]KMK54993.1 hypothetical protein Y699_09339 [Aspergillus fumigatus Z5]KAH2149843.1 hypothetical protein KXW33_004131 [Aspergillus fumigatus]KAH2488209.1 hypothetical protein KXV28_007539 [Aspergillus fumigatus]KAH2496279.1 hypothetical protein KXV76_005806 [Aspergillus fumigatus]